mmetsp:Transcript_697/g.2722  ORF Transcript_697/g.2722 Transcript_697/m.2722 type:complete len:235 (+) Transcript_697:528-1232(+)
MVACWPRARRSTAWHSSTRRAARFRPCGCHLSSPPCAPRTAATSTASAWTLLTPRSSHMLPSSGQPTRKTAGDSTERVEDRYGTAGRTRLCVRGSACLTRRGCTRGSFGSSRPALAGLDGSTWTPRRPRRPSSATRGSQASRVGCASLRRGPSQSSAFPCQDTPCSRTCPLARSSSAARRSLAAASTWLTCAQASPRMQSSLVAPSTSCTTWRSSRGPARPWSWARQGPRPSAG